MDVHVFKPRRFRKSRCTVCGKREEPHVYECACGNNPLSEEDLETMRCLCCRTRHLFYHDDMSCRRCGCPRDVAFATEG
jgi:hypothetical protein